MTGEKEEVMAKKEMKIVYDEYQSVCQLSASDRNLAEAAIRATENAYTPYSHFNVGAAARLSDGTVVTGSNQENMAFPSGLCAERTALFYAGAHYPDLAIEAIAIAACRDGKLCPVPATPCGACRQVMAEYQDRGGKPMEILMVGSEKVWKFYRVDDLLPLIFDSLK